MLSCSRQTILFFSVWLTACNNLPTQTDRAALIARATPESNAELLAVLEQALGPREILLAPDALTQSSILTLEQGSGLDGPARGRVLGMPERFSLVLSGERCYLVQTETAERWLLEQTACVPAEP